MPLRRRNPFYFTGHVVTGSLTRAAAIEFVVAPRIPEAYTLTPDNRQYFCTASRSTAGTEVRLGA